MPLKIALVGNDFNSSHPVFTRLPEALTEAATTVADGPPKKVSLHPFTTEAFARSTEPLERCDAICVAPSPFTCLEGLYRCARYAREKQLPWLSICGGTQYLLIEFGRNVLNLKDPGHVEQDPRCRLKLVNFLPDRYRVSNDGPLKSFPIEICPATQAAALYSAARTEELFFANYMLDPDYYRAVAAAGLICSATFDDRTTPCLVELKNHPFFLGALFQPQMASSAASPHPLLAAFLTAAARHREAAR